MDFGSINFVGVLAAFAASFFVGFLWFGPKTFYPMWWKALGKSPATEPGTGSSMGVVFGSTALAGLVLAFATSIVVSWSAQVNGGDFTAANGIMVGLVLGGGVVSAQALSHRLFGQQGWKVWAIESGGDVASSVAAGIVLSFFY